YLIDNFFDYSSLKSKSFKDSLSSLLKSLGLRVFYENGYYWIIRIGDIMKDNLSIHNYEYNENGVIDKGKETLNLSKELTNDINVINSPIKVSIDKMYKSVKHTIPLEYRELLHLPRFGISASPPNDSWDFSGNGSFINIEASEPTYSREGIDKKMTLIGGDKDDYVVQILKTGALTKEQPWFMSPIKIHFKIDVSKSVSGDKDRKISWKLRASKLQGDT